MSMSQSPPSTETIPSLSLSALTAQETFEAPNSIPTHLPPSAFRRKTTKATQQPTSLPPMALHKDPITAFRNTINTGIEYDNAGIPTHMILKEAEQVVGLRSLFESKHPGLPDHMFGPSSETYHDPPMDFVDDGVVPLSAGRHHQRKVWIKQYERREEPKQRKGSSTEKAHAQKKEKKKKKKKKSQSLKEGKEANTKSATAKRNAKEVVLEEQAREASPKRRKSAEGKPINVNLDEDKPRPRRKSMYSEYFSPFFTALTEEPPRQPSLRGSPGGELHQECQENPRKKGPSTDFIPHLGAPDEDPPQQPPVEGRNDEREYEEGENTPPSSFSGDLWMPCAFASTVDIDGDFQPLFPPLGFFPTEQTPLNIENPHTMSYMRHQTGIIKEAYNHEFSSSANGHGDKFLDLSSNNQKENQFNGKPIPVLARPAKGRIGKILRLAQNGDELKAVLDGFERESNLPPPLQTNNTIRQIINNQANQIRPRPLLSLPISTSKHTHSNFPFYNDEDPYVALRPRKSSPKVLGFMSIDTQTRPHTSRKRSSDGEEDDRRVEKRARKTPNPSDFKDETTNSKKLIHTKDQINDSFCTSETTYRTASKGNINPGPRFSKTPVVAASMTLPQALERDGMNECEIDEADKEYEAKTGVKGEVEDGEAGELGSDDTISIDLNTEFRAVL